MVNSRIILTAFLTIGTVVLAVPIVPDGSAGAGTPEGVGPEVGFRPPSIEKNWSSTRQLWSFQRRARDTGDSSYPSFPKIQPSLQVFLPLYSQTHIFGAYHISPKAVLPSREVQRGTGCGSSFGSSRIRFSNDASGPRHGA
ncbi:MAG: hypothetical protein NXY57DRAFT_673087 [Lentinula lateritia]|nr:MAG: hypothetical protein NXY57DRAFT_673087 [Lentinula lateritia]